MAVLGKAAALAAELGWCNAALYIVRRALARLGVDAAVVRYYLVAQPVAGAPRLPPRRGASIAVRRLGAGDPALRGLPLTEPVIRYRFDQDAICFGAFRDGAIVGCLWLCLGPYDEDEVRCRFVPSPADRAAWDFDVYVDPGHRTGLVFARLWDEADAFLRRRGFAWSISRISAFNPGSLASHASLGATRCGSLTAFRLGSWQAVASSLRPRLHVSSAGRSSGPRYEVPAPPEPKEI